jgi:hypothetical protein
VGPNDGQGKASLGEQSRALEIAKKMKNHNAPPEQIAEYTGLSYDEIAKL